MRFIPNFFTCYYGNKFQLSDGCSGKFLVFISTLFMLGGCTRTEPVLEFDWVKEEGYRWAELPIELQSQPGLEKLLSSLTGISFRNDLADERMSENRILMNGSGVAAGDINGDGQGNFEAVPGHVSGVKIYGEQRGAALGDFNRDGKTDLAVAQNSAEMRVFMNQGEKEGLRVRLIGPANNQSGIGSGIRLVYEDGTRGPVRTIQAGSGYWSQNSSVQVLGSG